MSILDEHPAPWRVGDGHFVEDAKGVPVAEGDLELRGDVDDQWQRLILAAPELLAALKNLLAVSRAEFSSEFDGTGRRMPGEFTRAKSLIDRIEKGAKPLHICGGCPPGVVGLSADELRHACERNNDGLASSTPPQWQCVLWAPHPGKPHEDYRGAQFDVNDPCWKGKL